MLVRSKIQERCAQCRRISHQLADETEGGYVNLFSEFLPKMRALGLLGRYRQQAPHRTLRVIRVFSTTVRRTRINSIRRLLHKPAATICFSASIPAKCLPHISISNKPLSPCGFLAAVRKYGRVAFRSKYEDGLVYAG